MFFEYKMNETVNKFLWQGDKFMSKMHLRRPNALGKYGVTYNACGLFTRKKETQKRTR